MKKWKVLEKDFSRAKMNGKSRRSGLSVKST
jgi:hypothetical protein